MLKKTVTTILFFAIFGTIVAFARGYRVNIFTQKVTSTGLIAVTSTPKSAKVYVNGEFKDVTDTTLSLEPGTYTISVVKEGYFTWQKTVTLKGEVVQSADAILYPLNSSLLPLTNIGVLKAQKIGNATDQFLIFTGLKLKNANISPTVALQGQTEKITYVPGIYTFDATKRTISFFQQLNKIAAYEDFGPQFNPQSTHTILSPLGDQGIIFELDPKTPATKYTDSLQLYPNYEIPSSYIRAHLISFDSENKPTDITDSVDTFISTWTQTKLKNLTDYAASHKKVLGEFLSQNTKVLDISLDKKHILYEATRSARLDTVLTEKPVGVNQTLEVRNVNKGEVYMYDLKEDKNYPIENASKSITYPIIHPNSKNLVYKEENSISISDYDGLNRQIVYSGPFDKQFTGVTSDGRLIIITNLNPQLHEYPDLYAVGIQ